MFSHSCRTGVENDLMSANNRSLSTTVVVSHRYVTIVRRYKGSVAFLNGEIDSPPVRGESRRTGNDRRFCENDSAGF